MSSKNSRRTTSLSGTESIALKSAPTFHSFLSGAGNPTTYNLASEGPEDEQTEHHWRGEQASLVDLKAPTIYAHDTVAVMADLAV